MKTTDLSRTELISLGRAIVTERLESIGCTVTPPKSATGGKRSEPEYGISVARSSLDKLERYAWESPADDYFR
jgi:hypothetical protein